jgi:CYTH domain-containing protein
MEIERKFLIKTVPENLLDYPFHLIEQAYLNTDPVIRIRKEDENYYLTYKGKGLMAREEYNLPLNQDAYLHLREKIDGVIISKKRYLIPLEQPDFQEDFPMESRPAKLIIELDDFHPPIAPLLMAEIEFETESQSNAFIPPSWFGEDVTFNRLYHNSNMSQRQF